MSDLDTEQLFMVYSQTNEAVGKQNFPACTPYEQRLWAENEMLRYLREDFFKIHGSVCAVWQLQRAYKSFLRLEVYRDGYLITSLETAPDARRTGYGYALLQAVLEYLRTGGCAVVYAHIEKRNVPSLRLHEKCGFVRISDSATYIDGTVTQRSCTVCCKL